MAGRGRARRTAKSSGERLSAHRSGDTRMGQPALQEGRAPLAESIGQEEGTGGTETS